MHEALLAKTHFCLRGMNVHVHLCGRHFEKQKHHREDRRRHDVAIGFGNCVLHQPIANQAAIHENENRVAIQLLHFRLRDESVQPELSRIHRPGLLFFILVLARPGRRLRKSNALQRHLRRNRQQRIECVFSDDLIDALRVARHGRSDDHGIHGRMQFEVHLRMR